jgi:glycosyltransferase involved in cell wall biosynthesis
MNDIHSPLVSVVITVYNGEKYIEQSIESILSQTYQAWELIIINDGSSDNTENLILKYPDKRIKYLRNDTNRGISFP